MIVFKKSYHEISQREMSFVMLTQRWSIFAEARVRGLHEEVGAPTGWDRSVHLRHVERFPSYYFPAIGFLFFPDGALIGRTQSADVYLINFEHHNGPARSPL